MTATAPASVQVSPFPMTSPIGGALPSVVARPLDAIPEIARRARAAQRVWGALPVAERVRRLAPLKSRVLDAAARIADVVHREVGKPEAEAVSAEVLATADVVDYWCDTVEEHMVDRVVELDPLSYPKKRGTLSREARGVVASSRPGTSRSRSLCATIVPALLAGNAVLLKPSEVSPRTGALIGEMLDGLLPDGLFEVVQGGGDVGAALSAAEVDLVSFTGSVATGRRVALACAERLIPCSLELGGKDAAIVALRTRTSNARRTASSGARCRTRGRTARRSSASTWSAPSRPRSRRRWSRS